ncbi:MAG: malate dehydrogenase, partial [Acidiphilium sp. 37-67-22]
AAVIEARGASSAASAANAAIDQVRDWVVGSNGRWVSMAIASDGSYGVPEGIMFGVPVTTQNGVVTRIQNLEIDAFAQSRLDITLNELKEEREAIAHLLG